jgi:hypothetical protein
MKKLTVRLVERDKLLNIYKDDEPDIFIHFATQKEMKAYKMGLMKGFTSVAKALNLSFKQEGEYIYLEGK